jgi:hypothetical protein
MAEQRQEKKVLEAGVEGDRLRINERKEIQSMENKRKKD